MGFNSGFKGLSYANLVDDHTAETVRPTAVTVLGGCLMHTALSTRHHSNR